jgi:DNA-directed RNA polymerase subunit RPC12/RpoP
MHFLPRIDRTPRLDCPHCGLLTPKAERECVHCGREIPESYRQREKAAGKLRRKHAKLAALVLVPVGILLLTWFFMILGQ